VRCCGFALKGTDTVAHHRLPAFVVSMYARLSQGQGSTSLLAAPKVHRVDFNNRSLAPRSRGPPCGVAHQVSDARMLSTRFGKSFVTDNLPGLRTSRYRDPCGSWRGGSARVCPQG
jgi:hypothetical protein